MRFVSLNAWGGKIWPGLADWVSTCDADILCLQEVTRAPVDCPERLYYRDAYRELEQRADLFADISRRLPRHQARFAAAARGTLQSETGEAFASEHGIAFWVGPEAAISASYQGFIHGSFRADGWGAEPVPRTIQIAQVELGGGSFVFGHLHGLRDPDGKGDTPARAVQCERIIDALERLPAHDAPIILAGDFNLLPDSATFARLEEIGLSDLVTAGGFSDTRTSLYRKSQRFADYLLVSDRINVTDFALPATPEVSDHRPLILEFEVWR